ncbi:hypothetical protein EJ994_14065 [Maribacter sp. MJ134]|uniref:hypothetical protein n=1 Tax=Maribacter sp. MJ134 TaxID=2496865 RepID=UPI000F82EC2C|nr:hypothetical protein [Maribacter sp. MJ134]AZQ59866.1 hypothetical protein EJ994_14065 [Maribacter sp. MJ134]
MEKDIRKHLIELARLRTTRSYSQVNDVLMLGLDFSNDYHRSLVGEWLGNISAHEFEKGRPLLSALVTHKNGQREQGDGFYKLCADLLGKNWEDLKKDKEWENGVIAKCYEFWLDKENFKNFENDFK